MALAAVVLAFTKWYVNSASSSMWKSIAFHAGSVFQVAAATMANLLGHAPPSAPGWLVVELGGKSFLEIW